MFLRTFSLFLCFSLFSVVAFGSGIAIVDGAAGTYFHVRETNTSVVVTDQIAIVTSTQVFENRTDFETKFKYAFPLNETSNPTNLRWKINGVWTTADISANEQDTDIPGTGGSGGGPSQETDPNLTAYLGDYPLFFSPRSPLAAGGTVTVEITYVELLPYFLGKVSFYQKNAFAALQAEAPQRQTLDFRLTSRREVVSAELLDLEHEVSLDDTTATITLLINDLPADFDYALEYELSSEGLNATGLSTYLQPDSLGCADVRDGYFTLIIEPESSVNTEVIEKNFTLVIDRSGSMGGDKIVQARDAASFITRNLNFGDNFNIIDFSTTVASAFPTHQPFTLRTEREALDYISELGASGGTNISGSLVTAINQFAATDEGKANIIIFFTDGQATSGITTRPGILDAVAQAQQTNETNVFLYTVGIGLSPDRGLLIELARENSGQAEFVDAENLLEDLGRLFLSINNPVLINTEINITPTGVTEIYPNPVPNLYQGQQLILSGRYNEPLTINVSLSGQAFNVPVTYDFPITLVDSSQSTLSFLPKVWAKQKLDALQENYYITGDTSILNLIDSISTCYGVVNINFSSFEETDGGSVVETDDLRLADATRNIRAFPTVFTSEVEVEFLVPVPAGPVRVAVLNVGMQTVAEHMGTITDGRMNIDRLGDLKPGIYFLRIEVEGQLFMVKVVKG